MSLASEAKFLLDPRGRVTRAQVLRYLMISGLGLCVYFLLTELFHLPIISDVLLRSAMALFAGLMISLFSVASKRFHDFGVSAIVPAILIIAAAAIWWRGFGDDFLRNREQTLQFEQISGDVPTLSDPGLSPADLQQAFDNLSEEDFARIKSELAKELSSLIGLVAFGAAASFLLLVMPGRHGPNRFGPDPREMN